ncbi:MAG: VanZ family protein [Gammaproteobacteria bacterium]
MAALLALLHAALVAHLLFIPYAYEPLPLAEALRRALAMPWLVLGIDQNVALVSRALMFLPLGLLLAAVLSPRAWGRARLPAALAAWVLGTGWGLAVNVAQLWFPGRTVSLNNLLAESVGVLVGALLWSGFGDRLRDWRRLVASGGPVSMRAALGAYVLLYLVLSLLPLDFVTSAAEFGQKLDGGQFAWWVMAGRCGAAPCHVKYLALFGAAMPCGWWFADRHRGRRPPWGRAALVATIISVVIEGLHFPMVSGVSEGVSLLLRTAGMLGGVALHAQRGRLIALDLDRLGRPAVLALSLPYLLALAYAGGWFRSGFLGLDAGLARVGEIVWMPFHHQYYAPYADTMMRMLAYTVLYAPVGIAAWAWWRRRDQVPLWIAPAVAAVLAAGFELAKVFLEARYTDSTLLLVAAGSAWAACLLLRQVSGAHRVPASRVEPDDVSGSGPAPRVWALMAALVMLLAAVATVVAFPLGRWILGLGLTAYALLLARHPRLYLVVVPLALPSIDLAPWSGRLFWDEFDALLAVTVGVRLLTWSPARAAEASAGASAGPIGRTARLAMAAMALSVGASAALGFLSAGPLDANAFTSYLGQGNALRIAKGYGWAALLLWLLARDLKTPGARRLLVWGLAAGLAAVIAGVLAERLWFLGTPELSTIFRAAGMVSATHTGGAYLEVLPVVLAPWAVAGAAMARVGVARAACVLLVSCGMVALWLTASRAAAAAWLLSMLVFAWAWWRGGGARVLGSTRRSVVALAIAGAAVALAAAVAFASGLSPLLLSRFASSLQDLPVRLAHWDRTLRMIEPDAVGLLLGAGLGSYPRLHYLNHAIEDRLPAYMRAPAVAGVPARLVLTGGGGLYLDQRLRERPDGVLSLQGRVRALGEAGRLNAALCVKSMMYSMGCRWAAVEAGAKWREFTVEVQAPGPVRGVGWLPAPVSLSLHNASFGAGLEISGLSLRDGGVDLLYNGSFDHGLDGWFMTSDTHLAWRTHNVAVQTLFEQGLLGLFAAAMLLLAIARGLGRLRGAGGEPALRAAITASLTGLLVIGAFDSPLDWPRLVALLALCMAPALLARRGCGGAGFRVRGPIPPRGRRSSP